MCKKRGLDARRGEFEKWLADVLPGLIPIQPSALASFFRMS